MSLSRRTLAIVALLAGLATALVVRAGVADTTAQRAARATLAHPPTVTAVSRGETIIALAPKPAPVAPSRHITPPAVDTAPAAAAPTPSAPTPAVTAAATTATTTTTTSPTDVGLPRVKHVFVVALSTESRADAFSRASGATYLHSLLARGTLLTGYQSLGHGELADQLAAISGQAPNPATSAGCRKYVAFPLTAVTGSDGTVAGTGCVYPSTTLSLADQVTNAGHSWGAYVEGMGETPCPTPQTNGSETAAIAGADADYDTIHNPFIFFPSLTESGACYLNEGDTDLKLTGVLTGGAAAMPTLAYVAPAACADGARSDLASTATTATTATTTTSAPAATTQPEAATTTTDAVSATSPTTTTVADTTTDASTTTSPVTTATSTVESSTDAGRDDVCAPGQSSGIPAEDQFLSTWVPQILASKAYRDHGVLIIAFAGVTSRHGDRPYPTGALVISHWTAKGKRIAGAYTPFSLLHSVEDMLDLQPLAAAADSPVFARRVL